MTTIIFESHATSLDNEQKLASGWNDVELSEQGKLQAVKLGARYKNKLPDLIITSDLQRARMTAEIAFENSITIFTDKRLRECNYGEMTQKPSELIETQRRKRVKTPFLKGESLEVATSRVKECINEIVINNMGKTIMVIGHRATQYGIEMIVNNTKLDELVREDWSWQPGWVYYVSDTVTL